MAAVAPNADQAVRDFAARAAEAQQLLTESIAKAGLQRDPHRFIIEAESHALGVLADVVSEIDRRRQPVRDDELRRAVAQGVSGHAAQLVHMLNIRNILIGSGLLAAALLIGAGTGYWFRGDVPVLVGVRAGAEKCDDHPDGSRLCWIPVWERLPPNSR